MEIANGAGPALPAHGNPVSRRRLGEVGETCARVQELSPRSTTFLSSIQVHEMCKNSNFRNFDILRYYKLLSPNRTLHIVVIIFSRMCDFEYGEQAVPS